MSGRFSGEYQVIKDCDIGEGTEIWHFVNLYGCSIGKDCMIGSFVEFQPGVKLGDNVRVQSHSFLCSRVTVEDDVFIGHGVKTINDLYPPRDEKYWQSTLIKKGAKIGSNSTLLPVTIGEGSVVGGGSVVTRDVPPGVIVAGNPARVIRKTGEKR